MPTTNSDHKIGLSQKLKDKILSKEEKRDYYSKNFKLLEESVKGFLEKQDGDNALKTINSGSLYIGSSDVHYDCFKDYIVVRFRIDGILVDIFRLNHKEYKFILERIKYSSSIKLNITTIPQDGKYSQEVDGRNIDIRISTLPTKYGENIVARLLDSEKSVVSFEDLGFYWTSKRMIEKSISKNNGLILVTGPTGSGKTTTLYTILNKLNTREKKLITLEDPIEYEMNGVIQSEIDESKGFTFNSGLRALLRQDPDIIMVGEIRDLETLETTTTASLTGHLVLSTLHTKSAAETLDRMLNMGLKPYILSSSLDTIIAQRLVRKICPDCKQEKEKTSLEFQMIRTMMDEIGMKNIGLDNIKLYEGKGCNKCNNSGYKGRIGVFEIISMNNKLRDLIREGASSSEIITEARNGDLITMKEDGILKAIRGFTTIEEIIRVV